MPPDRSLLTDGTLHRVLVFLLLPLIAQLGAAAHYGGRSVMFSYGLELGLDYDALASIMTTNAYAHMGGLLLGGLLALALGPRWTLLAGLALLAATAPLAFFASPDSFRVAVLAPAVVYGMLAPALIAAVVEPFAGSRFLLRAGAVTWAYAGTNAGAFAASNTQTAFDASFGPTYAGLGAAAGLGALLALGFALIPAAPDRAAALDRRAAVALGKGAVLVALMALPVTALWLGQEPFWTRAYNVASPPQWLHLLNPAAVMLLAPLVGAMLVGLHFGRLRFPVLLPAGLALGVGGAAGALVLVPYSAQVHASVILATAIVEVMLIPVLLAEIAGDVHWRLSTAMVAAWMLAGRAVYLAASPFVVEGMLLDALPIACAVICALGGLALAGAALPWEWFLRPMLSEPGEGDASERAEAA